MGKKYVYALIKNQPLINVYKKIGFVEGSTYTHEMIKTICDNHFKNNTVITLTTTVVPDFNDWREVFSNFGRIIRDNLGNIVKYAVRSNLKGQTESDLNKVIDYARFELNRLEALK